MLARNATANAAASDATTTTATVKRTTRNENDIELRRSVSVGRTGGVPGERRKLDVGPPAPSGGGTGTICPVARAGQRMLLPFPRS